MSTETKDQMLVALRSQVAALQNLIAVKTLATLEESNDKLSGVKPEKKTKSSELSLDTILEAIKNDTEHRQNYVEQWMAQVSF